MDNPLGFPRGSTTLTGGLLGEAYRRRAEWNDRFSHWERPASVSEEGTIERAAAHVKSALSDNAWLQQNSVVIKPQGSYHNNTNVRQEADIDLRAECPLMKIGYGPGVIQEYADTFFSHTYRNGLTFAGLFSDMRGELVQNLSKAFGVKNIDVGNKAIRVKGITGSRAEVDVVPVVNYRWITWVTSASTYRVDQGVALYSQERWILNFPEQHNANGIAKRSNTAHRFKRMVRIFKRLRADMAERGLPNVGVPSFLVECLVYVVENPYFLQENDDSYDRVRRVALRMQELLGNRQVAEQLREINGLKLLFGAEQAWTYEQAKAFVDTVVAHLGAL